MPLQDSSSARKCGSLTRRSDRGVLNTRSIVLLSIAAAEREPQRNKRREVIEKASGPTVHNRLEAVPLER